MSKILFIKKGRFSNINHHLLQQFGSHYGPYTIEVFDVVTYVKKRPVLLAINIFFVLKEYGSDFLTRRKRADDLKKVFFCTTFLFRHLKKRIQAKVKAGQYRFTFQTQSLHDCSSPGIPHFVYTDHTVLVNAHYPDISPEKYLKSPAYVALEQAIYKNAAKVFVLGSHVARSLVDDYQVPTQQVVCVGAGYNISVTNPSVEEARYARKNILFVGIDWERKGGPLLLEAFQHVLKQHPDARLTIVGSSPKVAIANCQVAGKIPLTAMPAYFEQASLFCMPSLREPFGIVYIEAMLYRLPVVARNLGAAPDFIQPGVNGFLVENSAEQLAAVLDRLLQSPALCKALGEQGYRIASERYSWEHIGNRITNEIAAQLDRP